MYHAPRYDRALLLGEKRNEILTLDEVRQYGQDSFGDPDYVCVYGLTPPQWYARGARLLGRTAVECTRDPLASLIARDVAALADVAGTTSRLAERRQALRVVLRAQVEIQAEAGEVLRGQPEHRGIDLEPDAAAGTRLAGDPVQRVS